MSKYRHLGAKDAKKLKFYKKSGKIISKGFKWWSVVAGILFILAVGVFAFYKFIDQNSEKSGAGALLAPNKSNMEDDTADLDQTSKNELERESEKAETKDARSGKRGNR